MQGGRSSNSRQKKKPQGRGEEHRKELKNSTEIDSETGGNKERTLEGD